MSATPRLWFGKNQHGNFAGDGVEIGGDKDFGGMKVLDGM